MCSGGEGNSSQKGNDTVSRGKGPTRLTKLWHVNGSGGTMPLRGKQRSALQMVQCKASMELINKNKKENIPPQSSAPNYMSAILLLDNVNTTEATITNEGTLMSTKRHFKMRLPRQLCALRLQKLKNPSTKFKSLWLALWRGRWS